MAINWIEGVLQNSRHSGSDLLLMIVLAEAADRDHGTCYPGRATIARLMRMSERNVQRCIKTVTASGEVSVMTQASHYGTNLYVLNPSLLKGGDNLSGGDKSGAKGETSVSPKPLDKPSDNPPLPPQGGQTRSPRKKNSYTPEFEAWWTLYPSGRGIKIDAFDEWQLLSDEDQDAAMSALPAWVASQKWQTEPQYIPHAERWLKKRRWEGAPPPSATAQDYSRIPNLTAPPNKPTRIDWNELLPDGTKRYIQTETALIDRLRVRP